MCVCVFVSRFAALLVAVVVFFGGRRLVLSFRFGGVLALFAHVVPLVDYVPACVGCLLPRARARVRVVCACVHVRPG